MKRRVTILCPLYPHNNRSLKEELAVLLQKGFVRVEYQGKISRIEDLLADTSVDNSSMKIKLKADSKKASSTDDSALTTHYSEVKIVIDRITKNETDETISRLGDSVQTAFFEGKGDCYVRYREPDAEAETERFFCDRFELDGISFEEPTPNFFSFNNPYGACKRCEGYGKIIGIDEDLVIPDKSKSVYDGAIAPWRGEKMREWNEALVKSALKLIFPSTASTTSLPKNNKVFCGQVIPTSAGWMSFLKNWKSKPIKFNTG